VVRLPLVFVVVVGVVPFIALNRSLDNVMI
jgi:hypothetical protein